MKNLISFLLVIFGFIHFTLGQSFQDIHTVIPAYLPDTVSFAGENVPLNDEDVKSRLQYEIENIVYSHSRTLLILKRYGRWKKIIQDTLLAHQVPIDFFYLAVAESNLDPIIESPAKALGMWQFLEGTGKEFGLLINECTDERQDPLKAAVAACQYFKQAYQNFGTWTASAASYNRGMAGLLRAMENQGTKNYYDLFLNSETSRYVLRIVALKLILENPQSYGYCVHHYDYFAPFEFDEVSVTEKIESVPEWAKKHGMSYKEFRFLNPAIIIHGNSYSFTPPKNGYVFRVKKTKKN